MFSKITIIKIILDLKLGTGHKNTNDADEEAESEEKISLGSRKEKSLGKLCGRFLLTMGQAVQGGNDIHLETLARAMCEQFGSSMVTQIIA